MSLQERIASSFPVTEQVTIGTVKIDGDDKEGADPLVVALSLIGDRVIDRLADDETGPFHYEFLVPGAPHRQRVTIENIEVAANTVGPVL